MTTAALERLDHDLPEPVARRGITEAQWRTLCNSLFPGADPKSVLMVIDYCTARQLDPMKKPCHIVPMRAKDARTGEWGWRDVVMPGIYEYRTTAQRTREYLGHSKPEYGPAVDHLGVKAPEWCEMTMYRHSIHGGRIEFPVRRYFAEVVGLTKDNKVNDRWSKAPIQMLEKCTEAAGLREAFPDEFGGETTAEEMDDQRVIDAEPVVQVTPAQRKSQQAAADASAPRNGVPSASGSASLPAGVVSTPVADLRPEAATASVSQTPPSPNIGTIADIITKEAGSIVKLSTGYQAATRDAEILRALVQAKAGAVRVELVTKPPRDPKYAAIIMEVLPTEAAQ